MGRKKGKMKHTMMVNEVADCLKQDEFANWSYAGAKALAEYYEEYENETGEEIEFDRVAIRCDWSEFKSLSAWAIEYFGGESNAIDGLDNDLEDDVIRDYINDKGQLIEFDGGVIVNSF